MDAIIPTVLPSSVDSQHSVNAVLIPVAPNGGSGVGSAGGSSNASGVGSGSQSAVILAAGGSGRHSSPGTMQLHSPASASHRMRGAPPVLPSASALPQQQTNNDSNARGSGSSDRAIAAGSSVGEGGGLVLAAHSHDSRSSEQALQLHSPAPNHLLPPQPHLFPTATHNPHTQTQHSYGSVSSYLQWPQPSLPHASAAASASASQQRSAAASPSPAPAPQPLPSTISSAQRRGSGGVGVGVGMVFGADGVPIGEDGVCITSLSLFFFSFPPLPLSFIAVCVVIVVMHIFVCVWFG